ncbi:MAG: CvpA family protein [Lachnospiraceae bacterium]
MNELEIGIIVFLLLMVLAGMFCGLIRCVFGIAALFLSTISSFLVTKLLGAVAFKTPAAQAICFLVVFLMVYIAAVVVMISLNILAHLPVISTMNRLGGAILGALLGLLCVWIFMAVVTVLANNPTAANLLEMINDSEFLLPLYENNIIDLILQEHLWEGLEIQI